MTGLEAFKIVYNNFDYLISDVGIENDDVNICLKTIKEQLPTIKQALQRLETIDNANPSEALKCLESIKDALWDDDFHYQRHSKLLDTIEQALLKAQKEHKALEILKRNVKVSIDYGEEEKDISMALVVYIDNKKTIYVVDEAIKEKNPEHFKELELLREVLE